MQTNCKIFIEYYWILLNIVRYSSQKLNVKTVMGNGCAIRRPITMFTAKAISISRIEVLGGRHWLLKKIVFRNWNYLLSNIFWFNHLPNTFGPNKITTAHSFLVFHPCLVKKIKVPSVELFDWSEWRAPTLSFLLVEKGGSSKSNLNHVVWLNFFHYRVNKRWLFLLFQGQ